MITGNKASVCTVHSSIYHTKEYTVQYISNRTDSTLLRLPNICPPNLPLPESMSLVKTWKFETGKKGLLCSGFDSNIGKCIKE